MKSKCELQIYCPLVNLSKSFKGGVGNVALDDASINQSGNAPARVRKIGFMEGLPLQDSFFEPLPEEELELWGL